MGTSKCFMFMRILILTTMATSVALNAAIIGALVTKRDCKFAEPMRFPGIFLVLFVLLYLAFNLLWPVRTSLDEKICSQVLLENGHGYKVGNKRNHLTDHLLGEFEDTIKPVGIRHEPVMDSECETTLREQVMVFDEQAETFYIREMALSKTSKDHLGQTVGNEIPVSEALHVDTTDSVSCDDSLFLSEDDIARNLNPPYGQASTSELHSGKNMLAMMNYLAAEGFANGEIVRDAVSAAISQQVAELTSIRRKEINDTLSFRNKYASSMNSEVQVLLFPSSHQLADILDDFWGNLFDLHGELTEKGNAIRLDLLIGLDVKEIKSCPCYFDVLPGGVCDPLKLNFDTMRMPPLFRISNNMCLEHGNCTLPAVVAFRRFIMDSFLTEDPTLLKDEEASYFAMRNDQVQYEFPIGMGIRLEELNKMEVLVQKCPSQQVAQQASKTNVYFSYNELKGLLLTSFRACILNISGKAGWLFENRGGYDEELVDMAFEMVMFGDIHPRGVFCPNAVVGTDGKIFNLSTSTLGCGDGCMWQPTLLISFGVWCISRIFEVLPSAKQPLLFGKYSRVLNRLQGILDPAFLKPVQPFSTCWCTKNSKAVRVPDGTQRISADAVLKMLMQVEATIFGAEGAEFFGREKKDLKSTLNRYILLLSKVASE